MTNRTTDLLAELRSRDGWKGSPSPRALLGRAADEIERLRARVVEQQEQLLEAWSEATGLQMRTEDGE